MTISLFFGKSESTDVLS